MVKKFFILIFFASVGLIGFTTQAQTTTSVALDDGSTGTKTLSSGQVNVSVNDQTASVPVTIISQGSTGVLDAGGIQVNSLNQLTIENQELLMKTENGNKSIKILPAQAITNARLSTARQVELQEKSQKPVYAINGERRAKFLGLFSFKLKVKAKVDAASGQVLSVTKPWWGFLAKLQK